MKKSEFILLLLFFVCVINAQTKENTFSVGGQVVGWVTTKFENPLLVQPGGRFVPELKAKLFTGEQSYFDFEASLNINGNVTIEDFKNIDFDGKIKPYRVWARYANQNFEIRAGLQKINFGQAKMFRPLMWFDGMDVRDPLQLTDGVYGVLGKYFFENNANIWMWGLLGNNRRKGWEFYATEKWKPEIGGRVEIPAGKGELALSSHFRTIEFQNPVLSFIKLENLNESRIGIDGKWDLGAGFWFENSTTITQKNDFLIPRFQEMLNVGVDYTFQVGNGLGVTAEYLFFQVGNRFLTDGVKMHLTGAMLTYPLSITDNISAILFAVPGEKLFFNYVSWNKTLDNWSFYLMAYINPQVSGFLNLSMSDKNLFAGKGIQLMCSYNF